MRVRELNIRGAWEFAPHLHQDSRGIFYEAFSARSFEGPTDRNFPLAQLNVSVSSRGVIRGIHAARRPPGQAKYVWCPQGHILDVVVDLRFESPTFGRHVAVTLTQEKPKALYLSEGLGHGFQVLSDSATVVYATTTLYNPEGEYAIHPLDVELDLPWDGAIAPNLSDRDLSAPTLAEVLTGNRPLLESS